jgi:hypothetical protein
VACGGNWFFLVIEHQDRAEEVERLTRVDL